MERRSTIPSRIITAMLLAASVPLSAATGDVDSELVKPAMNGHAETVQALLATGANVNANSKGIRVGPVRTALMLAAQGSEVSRVRVGNRRLHGPLRGSIHVRRTNGGMIGQLTCP